MAEKGNDVMLIPRFPILLACSVLMAIICLALVCLSIFMARKKQFPGGLCISFLMFASLYTGLRSIGIYLYAFDAVHHPSPVVSAFNIAATIAAFPTALCGLSAIFQMRRDASLRTKG